MRARILGFLLFAAWLLGCASRGPVTEPPGIFLWSIAPEVGHEPVAWLLGSVHIAREGDAIDRAAIDAFEGADRLAVELDPDAIDAATIARLIATMLSASCARPPDPESPRIPCSDETSVCAERCSRDPAETATGLCDETSCECITELTADCDDGWCRVPAVSFRMGREDSVVEWGELPSHPVVLTRSYLLQQTEVTVAAWRSVMGEGDDTRYACGLDCPVTHFTFFDALEFANRMSDRDGLERCYELTDCDDREPVGRECDGATFRGPDCEGYRLPSEAEWEAAASLGMGACIPGHPYVPDTSLHADVTCSVSVDLDLEIRDCLRAEVDYEGCVDFLTINGPACAGPGPVKEYPPNPLGLYGMQGNVWEMTGTRYRWPLQVPAPPFEPGDVVDPGFDREIVSSFRSDEEPSQLRAVVVKGGAFRVPAFLCCTYSRRVAGLGRPSNRVENVGLRLARTAPR